VVFSSSGNGDKYPILNFSIRNPNFLSQFQIPNPTKGRKEANREETCRGEEIHLRRKSSGAEEGKGRKEASKGKQFSRWRQEEEKQKEVGTYKIYIFKVLKQVHLDKVQQHPTITSREIQTGVRLVLLGELARHDVSEGT